MVNGEIHMVVPLQVTEDEETCALAACIYILERNPRSAGVSTNLTSLQKERIVRYLASRYTNEQ